MQEERKTLFKDLPIKTPNELLKRHDLELEKVLKENDTTMIELRKIANIERKTKTFDDVKLPIPVQPD